MRPKRTFTVNKWNSPIQGAGKAVWHQEIQLRKRFSSPWSYIIVEYSSNGLSGCDNISSWPLDFAVFLESDVENRYCNQTFTSSILRFTSNIHKPNVYLDGKHSSVPSFRLLSIS
jgi:hypothetical protein